MRSYDVLFNVDTEFCEPFKIRVFAENPYTAVFNATLVFASDQKYKSYFGYVRSVASVNLLKE